MYGEDENKRETLKGVFIKLVLGCPFNICTYDVISDKRFCY